MTTPAASSMLLSHCGMPAAGAVAGAGRGRGADVGGAGFEVGGPASGWAGPASEAGGAGGAGTASTVPGRITPGSGPMIWRLAAYKAGQPPRTASAAAMPDKVSPAATV